MGEVVCHDPWMGVKIAVYYLLGSYSHLSGWSYLFPLLWLLLQVVEPCQQLMSLWPRRQLCPYASPLLTIASSWVFRMRVQSCAFLNLCPSHTLVWRRACHQSLP